MILEAPINILSDSIKTPKIGGPKKVVYNTIKAFESIGQPFVLNRQIHHYKYNWVHDSVAALLDIALGKRSAILGPNIVQIPSAFPKLMPSLQGCLYLIHSNWHQKVWDHLSGKNTVKTVIWPVGIEIDNYLTIKASRKLNTRKVLVYFKGRTQNTYNSVLQTLASLGLEISVIICGNYNEDEYRKALLENSFCVWVGIPETQGIAMQEAMAAGMPIIVLDSKSPFEDSVGKSLKYYPQSVSSIESTSATYFDDSCGLRINNVSHLVEAIDEVLTNYNRFDPSDYIAKNLSLPKSAQRLINLFKLLEIEGNFDNMCQKNFRPSLLAKIIYTEYIVNRKIKSLFYILNSFQNAQL